MTEAAEPDVVVRRDGTGYFLHLLGAIGFGALGALVSWIWWREREPAIFGAALLIDLGAIGYAAYSVYRIVDRSVALTLAAEGLCQHARGRTIPWASIRAVRLYISKPSLVLLDAVLVLTVEEAGAVKVRRVSLMDLELPPEEVAALVERRVTKVWQRGARPD